MKKFLITVVTLLVVIVAILILGNVITIGDKMTQVFGVPYFEYAFYILLFGLLAYLIITPIHQIQAFNTRRIIQQLERAQICRF